jgi:hypothetical protein
MASAAVVTTRPRLRCPAPTVEAGTNQWVRPGRREAIGRQSGPKIALRGVRLALGCGWRKGNRSQERSLDGASINEHRALVSVKSFVFVFALVLGFAFPAQALNRAQDENQTHQADVPHHVPEVLVAGARWT